MNRLSNFIRKCVLVVKRELFQINRKLSIFKVEVNGLDEEKIVLFVQ